MPEVLKNPWSEDGIDVLRALEVERGKGLDRAASKQRHRKYGSNRVKRKKRKSAWFLLLNQFKSVIVLLLAAAALATFLVGRWVEGLAISVVVVFNAIIGFITELQAVRSMEALEKLSQSVTKVRRSGRVKRIPSWKLVPGDIVIFEAGDTVSADMRLVEAARVEVDESTLTGESVPVAKTTEKVDQNAPLAERHCMLFNGTAITRGSGEAVIIATGMHTELGRISEEIQKAEDEQTPLEDRLDQLGRTFIWLTVILSAAVVAIGWLMEKDLLLVVETGIALAVAAIPEGMPIVATIALARGMHRMASRNAIINRLSSVETLGGATVIATDKTGTLTENRMTVNRIVLPEHTVEIAGEGLGTEGEFTVGDDRIEPVDHENLQLILRTGVLCTNAELEKSESGELDPVGDPMESALLVAAEKAGMNKKSLLEEYPEDREVAFDPEWKMMATIHRSNEGYFFAVKGAPEKVLEVCNTYNSKEGVVRLEKDKREKWLEHSSGLAGEGLRILALAMKEESRSDAEPYTDLTFLGLVCLMDPPRQEVKEAITAAHKAGIRTIMVTGDQIATAMAIAKLLEMSGNTLHAMEGSDLDISEQLSDEQENKILQCTVFARVSPKQKLDLVSLFQQHHNVVAMTGDGVNDAPALEKADIGIAMGRRGTQVAREAADMILKDDSFSTIVSAIEEGRIIFANIRRFILFLLTISLNMILTVFFAAIINLPMPILPLQVLYLNAVTHVFPALALGMGEGSEEIMNQTPRDPQLPIIEKEHWHFIIFFAFIISLAALGGLAFCLDFLEMKQDRAQTVSFLIITFGQMLHVFNVRNRNSNILYNEITCNKYVWLAIAVSIFLTLAIIHVPVLGSVMQVTIPVFMEWIIALGFASVPLLIGQIYLAVWRKR